MVEPNRVQSPQGLCAVVNCTEGSVLWMNKVRWTADLGSWTFQHSTLGSVPAQFSSLDKLSKLPQARNPIPSTQLLTAIAPQSSTAIGIHQTELRIFKQWNKTPPHTHVSIRKGWARTSGCRNCKNSDSCILWPYNGNSTQHVPYSCILHINAPRDKIWPRANMDWHGMEAQVWKKLKKTGLTI